MKVVAALRQVLARDDRAPSATDPLRWSASAARGHRSPWSRASLYVLLGTTAVIASIGLTWGLPAFESWSNDDVTPGQVMRAARNNFTVVTKYPPFAYLLPTLVYAPYLAFLHLTGGLQNPVVSFPHGFTDPLTALTMLIILARVLSVAMAVGTVYFVHRGTEALLGDRRAALLAGYAVAFNSEFTLFAQLGNVDMQGLLWLAAAFACYARLIGEPRASTAGLLGITTALAFGTKDYLFFAGAGMALVLALVWIRDRRHPGPLAWGLGAFVIAYALVNNWVFGWSVYVARLRWLATAADQESIQYPATLAGHVALMTRALEHLVETTGWPMVLAIVAGCAIAGRSRPRVVLAFVVPVVTFYVGAIAPMRFVFPRYVLPWVLFLAPAAGITLSRLLDHAPRLRATRRLAVGVALGWSLFLAIRMDMDLLFDARYQAEDYLRTQVPRDARIEVYAPFTYLPRLREMGFTVSSLSPDAVLAPPSAEEGLRRRAPDVIVLSSKHLAEHRSRMRDFIKGLLTKDVGYRVTVFRGPHWMPGSGAASRSYVSRVNPTIWILERESDSAAQSRNGSVARP